MDNRCVEHPLRQWRKREGLTLEKAAEAVGTVRQVWYDWESGRRRPGPVYMPKLRDLTRGAISADHFYPAVSAAA